MKKRIVALLFAFVLLLSVGAQAIYYPNGGEAYGVGRTAPVFYLGRYWDRVTGYLSERSDPLIVQICADYGLEVPRPEPGKPERRFQFCGGKIYHSDYPDGDPRYPALSPRDEFLDYVGQAYAFSRQMPDVEPGYPAFPFSDVVPTDREVLEARQMSTADCKWYDDGIRIAVREGYFSGYVEGVEYYFYPEREMTRAEAVTTLMRAPYEAVREYQGEISDLVPEAWYEESVRRAYECGFIDGGAFRPDEPATREFVAMLLHRASVLSGGTGELGFTDGEEISAEYREAVEALAAEGVLAGYGDGSFRPHGTVLRAEFATMLGRLIERELIPGDTPNQHWAAEFKRRFLLQPYNPNVTLGSDYSGEDIPYPYFG